MSKLFSHGNSLAVFLGISLAILLGASGFFVLPDSYVLGLLGPNRLTISQQGITGNVTIEHPIPTCGGGIHRPPPPPSVDQLVIRGTIGTPMAVGLNYTYDVWCNLVASFRIALAPGAYSVDLLSCSQQVRFFGCEKLPLQITVNSDQFTDMPIVIQTAIL